MGAQNIALYTCEIGLFCYYKKIVVNVSKFYLDLIDQDSVTLVYFNGRSISNLHGVFLIPC